MMVENPRSQTEQSLHAFGRDGQQLESVEESMYKREPFLTTNFIRAV